MMMSQTNKLICALLLVLGLRLTSGVVYQERLNIEDLESWFGDEDCVEGSLSVAEDGDPVIKSYGYVSAVQPIISNSKAKTNNDTQSEKSPMSQLYELAEFNQVKVQFTLTDEKGPAHKKQFVMLLKLGEEEYVGEGPSYKKAQHEASKLALNSTLYGHPPKKEKLSVLVKKSKSSVEKLDSWARKHNDALVTYTYFEQSQLLENVSHKNYYHSGMYSKAENIYKAKVTVANQVFIGEGFSMEIAKQNAANNALQSLQTTDGFCMLSDKEKNFLDKVFDFNSDSVSPISLVHEFGTISNLPVSFDLYSEEGPAHIKKFTFRCNAGDKFESFGEGSSKKSAKREAAQNMIQELKKHTSLNRLNCEETQKRSKPKKKKSRNLIKSVIKSYSEEYEEEANHADLIPEDLDPVSKLFQIQQAKHGALPVFTPVEKSNNEFSIKVTIDDMSATGSGSNKKTAKKNAAQAMIEQMGYSATHKKDQNSQKKKKEFSNVRGLTKKKNIVPGINLNSNKIHTLQDIKEQTESQSKDTNKPTKSQSQSNLPQSKSQSNDKKSESAKKSNSRPKSQLLDVSQQMGFKFQFSDFSKVNNSGFVSIISLSTDPPKVCYGVGETSEIAQDKAAKSALGSLYKAQLNHLAQIFQEDNAASPEKPDINFIEEDRVVRFGIAEGKD